MKPTRLPRYLVMCLALTVPALGTAPAYAGPDKSDYKHESNKKDRDKSDRDRRGKGGDDDDNPRGTKVITMMEVGDHHGTMVPRPNLRPGDVARFHESGLAKMATIIKQVRKRDKHALLFNAGDTIQGSAEVLYTKGQAIVDVLDTFGIDAYAPGNWDWLYGKERTKELFGGGRWGVVAANAYDAETGERIFPAYRVLKAKGVKIGVIGMTAERGLPAVPNANVGIIFTDGVEELKQAVDDLRNKEKVDVVVLLSELGLAKNTLLADQVPGIDVALSSDMHEETPKLIETPVNGTLAAEIGWGGSRVAVLKLFVRGKRLVGHGYDYVAIEDQPDDPATAELVAQKRAPFLSGPQFEPHVNPISGHVLDTPIDTVVGITGTGLYRGNFANGVRRGDPEGVLEGTSHNLITDAFRAKGNTDFAMIRGFRYGTYVRPGEVTLGDLYTYLNAGAQLATGEVTGQQILDILERTIAGSLARDPFDWGGGWIFGFSGLTLDIDPNAPSGSRAQNVLIRDKDTGTWGPVDPAQVYTVTGYWFPEFANRVGAFQPASNVVPITNDDGSVMDPTEAVAEYLTDSPANPDVGRVEYNGIFPPPVFKNPEVQPLRGALNTD